MRKILYVLIFMSMTSCAPLRPQIVVIPDSMEIKEIPGEPGWFKISGGHLKSLYEQQRMLVEQLERCKLLKPCPPEREPLR